MIGNGYVIDTEIKFETWQDVENYLATQEIVTPSLDYLSKAASGRFPQNAFTVTQLASKTWLMDALTQIPSLGTDKPTIAILGSWVGSYVEFILDAFKDTHGITRIYGLDKDPYNVRLSDEFNARHVQNSWLYKGVIADIERQNASDMQFEVGGELISVRPDVLINTSCEHMDTQWFDTADEDQLIVMQSTNLLYGAEHINVMSNFQAMSDKYSLRDTLYSGTMKFPSYDRYMQIGYKYGRTE